MSFLAHYEAILRDRSVFEERNFVRRVEAIELLEEVVAAPLPAGERDSTRSTERDSLPLTGLDLLPSTGLDSLASTERDSLPSTRLDSLAAEAVRVRAALEEVDDRLFARLRAEIAAGGHRGDAFRELLVEYCGADVDEGPGYDTLDIFVNRLCSFLPMPTPTRMLEAEMVDFHKTPGRVVLELAQRIAPGDVFVDLGAGLGQVALLVHLLTGVSASGVEIEPTFCRYAWDCAAGLGLSGVPAASSVPGAPRASGVSFVEGDARFANYSEGTIFFMYTPFMGELLEEVFGTLRQRSLGKTFTLVTYGPCTMAAARQSWLRADDDRVNADALCFFSPLSSRSVR